MDSDLETARTLALVAVILNLVAFVFAVFTIIFAIFPLIWLLLDYFLIYKPLTEGNAAGAEGPSLALGIIQIIFLDIISGILLLITYVKIRDAQRNEVPSLSA